MRTDAWTRLKRRLLGLLFGSLALACFALLVRFGPSQAVAPWRASTVGELVAEPELPRRWIGSELLGVEVSEDFEDLLEAVADMQGEPTMESVRRLMEDRGWTELRYTLRIRHLMDAGGYDDIQYDCRPYETSFTPPEIIRILTSAHMGSDGVRIEVHGRRLDGRQAARLLGLEEIGPADEE